MTCVVLFVSPLACSCSLCCVSYRMLLVRLWICLLLLRAIHGWRFTVGRTRQRVLRCPGPHHCVARVSHAQAAWDGLRGLWKQSEGRGLQWHAQVGGRGIGAKKKRFLGTTGLQCPVVFVECDATCLWIYFCEYAALCSRPTSLL